MEGGEDHQENQMDIQTIMDLHARGIRLPQVIKAINEMADKTLSGLSFAPPGIGTQPSDPVLDPCARCHAGFRLTPAEVSSALDRLRINHVHANEADPTMDDRRHVFLFHLEDKAYIRRLGERLGIASGLVDELLERPIVVYDLVMQLDEDGAPATLYMTTESALLDEMYLRGVASLDIGRIMSTVMDWNARHISPAVTVTTPDGLVTVGTRWGLSLKRGMTREGLDDQIEWALETATSFWRSKMLTLAGRGGH